MHQETLDEQKVFKKVQQVIQINKESNLFFKAFLRPIQIALKTKETEKRKQMDADALAFGLKQVIKTDISLNHYDLQDFLSYEDIEPQHKNFKDLVHNNYDNMISFVKPGRDSPDIKLAICICMYSEDKAMLRKTLTGVENNIITFVKNGISADEIAVCVLMDGIEKVDESVVSFFEEQEKQMNVYLDDEVDPISVDQFDKSSLKDTEDEEVWNLNNFIFDEIQIVDRKKRRFVERKREYEEVKNMVKIIERLEKNKSLTYYDLDELLKEFFVKQAKENYRKTYNLDEMEMDKIKAEDITREYADNLKLTKSIIYKALTTAKLYCQKYISTRDNLAILNCFRVDIPFDWSTEAGSDNEKQQLNQEQLESQQIKMNLFFITKYKNSGKLSSHNWFFNGFCKEIPFEYAVLLDVGLVPSETALYRMFKYMDNDPLCGGVCGYMQLKMEALNTDDENMHRETDCATKFSLNFVDIQRAQQVEYHFGHLIDKPFQSIFNFIHVLPGAFSAYKMKALNLSSNESESSELMKEYFKSLDDTASDIGRKSVTISPCQAILRVLIPDFLYDKCRKKEENTDEQLLYDSNVYFAEDRTLCMGIHENGYKLHYLPDAQGWVDPIKTLPGLLGQRKRWINGSFFAFEKVRDTLVVRGCADVFLFLQMFYLDAMNKLAFISPALFLFTIHTAMFAFRDYFLQLIEITTGDKLTEFNATTELYNSFVYAIDLIYIMCLFGLIIFSMHFSHRNSSFITFVHGISTFFGVLAIIVFIVLLYDMIAGLIDGTTFLVDNEALKNKFFELLPGQETTLTIYKYLVVAVIVSYTIPILVFIILFCKISFAFEILFGALSFLFYTPTYLIILTTFALCRIDDISWGTKGLDTSSGGRTKELVEKWKTIKIINVVKFIIWNMIFAAGLLVSTSPIHNGYEDYQNEVASSYVRKLFVTFVLIGIIFVTFMIKILLGMFYSLKYRFCRGSIRIHKSNRHVNIESKLLRSFNDMKYSIYDQIKGNVYDLVKNIHQTNPQACHYKGMNSIIIHNKSINQGKPRARAVNNWKESICMKSAIHKKKQPSNSQVKRTSILEEGQSRKSKIRSSEKSQIRYEGSRMRKREQSPNSSKSLINGGELDKQESPQANNSLHPPKNQ